MVTRRKLLRNATVHFAALTALPTALGVSDALAASDAVAVSDTSRSRMNDSTIPSYGAVDRLYALNAGVAVAPDRSVYTPGRWNGEPITLPCNAYLIRRGNEWILWDTGIDDAVASESGGRIIAHNLRGIVVRTIADQLADIGIAAADISRVILSHGHFDHIGNARIFAHATWHMQRREHEALFGPAFEEYGYSPPLYESLRQANVELMDGDHDLFGDGSMRVLFTPGHTPGHSSLLVHLPNTGLVVLSADVAHYRHNLDNRSVPSFNSNPEESRTSMDKVAAIVRDEKAMLWLNHDAAQNATIVHAPAFYD